MSDWRLIETAPKDGSEFLAWSPDDKDFDGIGPHILLARWNVSQSEDWRTEQPDADTIIRRRIVKDASSWISHRGDWTRPSHWMPLPEPPHE